MAKRKKMLTESVTLPYPDPHGTCPGCQHPETDHVYWPADETCAGWAHCTVGSAEDGTACQCWRDWPQLPPTSN